MLACGGLFCHILNLKIPDQGFHPEFCPHESSFVRKMIIPSY